MPAKKNAQKQQSKKEGKQASKNGRKADGSGSSSFFTWFMVLALLGVWTSVAVVYFDLVDYRGVIGKLDSYDADGDGDFDVEDAKVLMGLSRGGGGGGESPDSLGEALDILAEEGSDWFQTFFTFLYEAVSPFDSPEDEEAEPGADEVPAAGHAENAQGQKTCVVLGLQNQ